jgi:hypothetical protein
MIVHKRRQGKETKNMKDLFWNLRGLRGGGGRRGQLKDLINKHSGYFLYARNNDKRIFCS